MYQLYVSMLSRICQACVLFIGHSSIAARRRKIMALGIYSTVDPRHASVSFVPQYIFLLSFDINRCLQYERRATHPIPPLSVLLLTSPPPPPSSPSLSEYFMLRSLSLASQLWRQTITSLSKLNVTTETGLWRKWNNVKHAFFFFFCYSTLNLLQKY